MKLCSITPVSGGLELRVYRIGHAADSSDKKSFGVTAPSVTSRMRRKCSSRGIRPATYLEIVGCSTPSIPAKRVCEILLAMRKSDSFIPDTYQAGTETQEACTALEQDIFAPAVYRMGMDGMEAARINLDLSRKALADLIGVTETTIGRWEEGTRPITDKRACQLAVALGVSPIAIKPDFNKHVLAALSPEGRRLFLDNVKMIFVAEHAQQKRAG